MCCSYVLDPKGSVRYNTFDTYADVEGQDHFFVSSLKQAFEDGVTHINVSDGNLIEMTEIDVNSHAIGVAMLQQFRIKTGIKYFGKKDKM